MSFLRLHKALFHLLIEYYFSIMPPKKALIVFSAIYYIITSIFECDAASMNCSQPI